MPPPLKPDFEALKAGMQNFLIFDEVEKQMENQVKVRASEFKVAPPQTSSQTPQQILSQYLQHKTEERLRVLITICGGSFEKFKRIKSQLFAVESFSKARISKDLANKLAGFLINPDREKQIPPFIRRGFRLPENWQGLLADERYIRSLFFHMLQSKYSVAVGTALEKRIVAEVEKTTKRWQKGNVEVVNNKEVDVAIPNCQKPRVLVMSSYNLTTSSAQSNRANEQARMYGKIQEYNRSWHGKKPPIAFVNVIDGGGWLSRQNDLRKIWVESDYCFALSQLPNLAEVINHYCG